MLLGLDRVAMAAKSGGVSAKSYVQDGLIAMWDGIENAGWGTHDASATTWKDLVGGNDLSIAGCSISSDGVYIPTTVNCGTNTLNASSFVASESVFNLSNNSASMAAYSSTSTTSKAGEKLFNTLSAEFAICGRSSVSGGYGTTECLYGRDVCVYASWYSSLNARSLVVDGESKIISETKGSSWFVPVYKFNLVPHFNWNGSKLGEGNVKSVRLYSRVLTAAEIAANYAIDKARFGLT